MSATDSRVDRVASILAEEDEDNRSWDEWKVLAEDKSGWTRRRYRLRIEKYTTQARKVIAALDAEPSLSLSGYGRDGAAVYVLLRATEYSPLFDDVEDDDISADAIYLDYLRGYFDGVAEVLAVEMSSIPTAAIRAAVAAAQEDE